MALSLDTIKPKSSSKKRRKRVGRGNASGKGTYSGKGLKGQKSRSGVSGLKRLGMKQTLLRTPKMRGFKSLKPKAQVVNLTQINLHFSEKETVNAKSLKKFALIDSIKGRIKVLGNGGLKIKNLQFQGLLVSKTALEKIEKADGKIID